MFVNQVNGTGQVDFQGAAVNPQSQSSANSAQNSSAMPEDTVTLSPAAQALQSEQQVLENETQNSLSPAAQQMQAEQRILAAETMANPASAGAALWMAALMLTTE